MLYYIMNTFLNPISPSVPTQMARHLSEKPPTRLTRISSIAASNVLHILTTAIQNRIHLPSAKIACADEIPEPAQSSMPEEDPLSFSPDFLIQNPRILVADDSPLALKLSVSLAKRLGFAPDNIITSQSRAEAHQKFREAERSNAPIDVIFSDRDMGNQTDGDRLAKEVKHVDPKVVFILISGTPPEICPPDIDKIYVKGRYKKEDIVRYLESTIEE